MITHFLSENEYILAFVFIFSMVITYISIPSIIYITVKKGLVAVPTDRCSHTKSTPVLGGVGIFIGVILSITLYSSIFESKNFNSLITAIIILFLMGVKDDIHMLSAKKKFVGQIIASLIVILISDIKIASLHGIFGIHQLNYYVSIFVTLFVYLLIINAYNLIDGIDGLAGTIGILISSFIGIYFYIMGEPQYAVISFSLTGALISFLYYNFSSRKKIFMGDTGSMIVGFLIAYLSIIAFSFAKSTSYNNLNLPIILIALFFYPLLDTLRIVLLRTFILKKSPFQADANHIHHRLISNGLKHWKATFLLSSITIILVASSCILNNLNINLHILITIVMGILFYSLPFIVFKFNLNKKLHMNNIIKLRSIAIFLVIMLFLSCSSKKEILYFTTGGKSTFDGNLLLDQKIEANDILSIRINSKDIETSKLYNLELTENSDNSQQPQVLKYKGYLVNNLGQIKLPVLGATKVNDMSINELEQFLTKKLITEGHMLDPTVIVRVLNAKVTVLGEVKMPGTFEFGEKNLTLLQAIGLAGDLTINGKRDDVILIRQENNTKTITHIDLTSTNWFETNSYYIKQNDVIVVNPNNAKIKSAGIIGNAGTFIALISLLLTGLLLLQR